MTADDFAFAHRTMRDEAVVTAHLLEPIDEAVALDPYTLELRLSEPSEYLPYLLTIPPAFPWPRHRCEGLGDDWRRPENLVGNGPFALAEYDAEGFRLALSSGWPLPRGNVRVVHYANEAAESMDERWLAGEFDLLRRFGTYPHMVSERQDTIVEDAAGLATWYLGFDVERPPFDDVLVRKAFSHASDRHRLKAQSKTFGEAAERGGVIPPPMPAHSHRAGLPYDPELAVELLAQAGYPEGRSLPELTLAARAVAGGEGLAEQWRETLGARTRIVSLGPGTPERVDAHAVMDGWIADYPNPGNFFRELRAGSPIRLHSDDRERALLDQARSLRDRRARIRVYNEVEKVWISEQAAVLPLEYMRQFALRRPWVEGYWVSATSGAPLDQVNVRRPARDDSATTV